MLWIDEHQKWMKYAIFVGKFDINFLIENMQKLLKERKKIQIDSEILIK